MLKECSILSPISDFIPVIGCIDDAAVIRFVWDLVQKDLKKYMAWKKRRDKKS